MSLQWDVLWIKGNKPKCIMFVPAQARMLEEAIEGWLHWFADTAEDDSWYIARIGASLGYERLTVEQARKRMAASVAKTWPSKYVSLDLEDYQ